MPDGTRHMRPKNAARRRGIANASGREATVQIHKNVSGSVPLTNVVTGISFGADTDETNTMAAEAKTKIANVSSFTISEI